MIVLKLFALFFINVITYPIVVLGVLGFFLLKKISLSSFIGKCGYVPLNNISNQEFIWFHVSSAGEWNTGKIFAKRLRERCKIPLLITYFNGDLTKVIEKEKKEGNFLSSNCRAIFLPIENLVSLGIIYWHYRIKVIVILETEIWPTLILMSHWLGKKIFLVNAVLFDKETQNFFRFKFLFSKIVNCFDQILCTSKKSKFNFLKLGVSAEKLTIKPNFKYDLFDRVEKLNKNKIKNFKKVGKNKFFKEKKSSMQELEFFLSEQLNLRKKIIIFASFHLKEILKILTSVKKFFLDEKYCIVVAPREISSSVIISLEKLFKKNQFSYIKRSELTQNSQYDLTNKHYNLLLDSFGELSSIYSLAHLVIMGGTFIPIGGHNFLEAVFFNKMVFLGRFIYHYEDFVDNFKDHVKKTSISKISLDIDDFFSKNHYLKLRNGFKKLQKFSGSSIETADFIYENIKFLFLKEKI